MRAYLDPCPVCRKADSIGYPKHDGHGIFLHYACDACHEKELKHYRPDIMSRYECDEPIEPEDY